MAIAAGAVGGNIEDGLADGTLRDVDEQAQRIAAARHAAQSEGATFFINARTDVFLRQVGPEHARAAHAIDRLRRYADAGADGAFAAGIGLPADITSLVEALSLPLNVLVRPGLPSIPELNQLGVSRLSLGSAPMLATLGLLKRLAEELVADGSLDALRWAMPYVEANDLF
jgi:2-methylisocitrate lyase-like PEP mutase family enzyme